MPVAPCHKRKTDGYSAVVTTVNAGGGTSGATSRNLTGVVELGVNGIYGTGSLLWNGRAVLTAAHVAMNWGAEGRVTFHLGDQKVDVAAAAAAIHPLYDPMAMSHDLAIVWLAAPAPLAAQRQDIYRGTDELGQRFDFAGYGYTGTGAQGYTIGSNWPPQITQASNQFDVDGAALKELFSFSSGWNPSAESMLVADFDSGSALNNALDQFKDLNLLYSLGTLPSSLWSLGYSLGLGTQEGMIAPGDSGGPAFIGSQIAGVASYVASLSLGLAFPDVVQGVNSSYGELGFWTRVSNEQRWIDQTVRQLDPNAPKTAQQVRTVVTEPDSGTTLAYFFVDFTGSRLRADDVISFSYRTKDGTALAGTDYLPTSGRLNLYPGETNATIPVEIIGDRTPEATEYFQLEAYDLVNAVFADAQVSVVATRTVLDTDSLA